MTTETLFDLPSASVVATSLPPRHSFADVTDEDIRRAYDTAPALSAFSRKPMPLELARGTRSHSRAMAAAVAAAGDAGPCSQFEVVHPVGWMS